MTVKLLSKSAISEIVSLTKFLNPEMEDDLLLQRQTEMFSFQNHICFGCYHNDELIGISSGWITVRLYSGKQLEIDNVIIHPEQQSKGVGALFLDKVEHWARENDCLSVELNAYVDNARAHKFYFKQGYKILGFHFRKLVKNHDGNGGCFVEGTVKTKN